MDDTALNTDGLEQAAGITLVVSATGTLQQWSSELSTVTGYDDRTLESMTLAEVCSPSGQRTCQKALTRATNGETVSTTTYIETAAGDQVPYVVTLARTDRGDAAGDSVIVTGVYNGADGLDVPAQFFEEVAERTGVGVATYNEAGKYTSVNEKYASLLARAPETLVGTEIWQVNPALDPDRFENYWQQFSEGDTRVLETTLERKDGTTFPAEIVSTRMRFDGEPYQVGTIKDITRRKEHREQLKAERDRFTALFETVAEPLVHVKYDGKVPIAQAVNKAFENVFGFEAAEVVGENIDDFVVPPHLTEQAQEIDRRVKNFEPVKREVRRMTVDGPRDFLLRVKPFETNDESSQYVAMYADISEQKERQRALEKEREQLELLNRIVRHDIRNDMQLILSSASLIEERSEQLPEEIASQLEQITESSNHVVELTEIVRDLMEAMMDRHEERERIGLGSCLRTQVKRIDSEFEEATVELDSTLPETDVMADDMLESVFRNLIANGVRHNDSASPTVRVSVTESDDTVVVRVADDGPGVPESRQEEIFDKGDKRQGSDGTGMGLYLVDTLVDQYEGELWVEDNDPTGAVFCVELEKAESDGQALEF